MEPFSTIAEAAYYRPFYGDQRADKTLCGASNAQKPTNIIAQCRKRKVNKKSLNSQLAGKEVQKEVQLQSFIIWR